jgi:hypothetical protein
VNAGALRGGNSMIQPGDQVSFDGLTGQVVEVTRDGHFQEVRGPHGDVVKVVPTYDRVTIEAVMYATVAATGLFPPPDLWERWNVCTDPFDAAVQAAQRLPALTLMQVARAKIEAEIKP